MLGMDKLKKIFKLYYILLLELFYCDGFRFFFFHFELFSELFGIKSSLHFYAIRMLCTHFHFIHP